MVTKNTEIEFSICVRMVPEKYTNKVLLVIHFQENGKTKCKSVKRRIKSQKKNIVMITMPFLYLVTSMEKV